MVENRGPDCCTICDVIYDLLCDGCENEKECHNNGVDHSKMLYCSLEKLVVKSKEEVEQEKILNEKLSKLINMADKIIDEYDNEG